MAYVSIPRSCEVKQDSTFTFYEVDESNLPDDLVSEWDIMRSDVKTIVCSESMTTSPLSLNGKPKESSKIQSRLQLTNFRFKTVHKEHQYQPIDLIKGEDATLQHSVAYQGEEAAKPIGTYLTPESHKPRGSFGNM